MADYHLSMKPISRSSGRSAVAAAAYRAGVRLEFERTGEIHDFTAKQGIVSVEIFLPKGLHADWALDRERLWNAAETAEVRKDARVAREFEVALPHELDGAARQELVREFAQILADRYGVAVDAAIHAPNPTSDQRNHHAHVMVTTRKVGPWGLGDKSDFERENAWLIAQGKPSSHAQLRQIRQDWEDVANVALQRAGLDIRIDHRSYEDRGIDLIPSTHVGVFGTRLGRRGAEAQRVRLSVEDVRRNADLVRRAPSQILDIVSAEKSVFTQKDVRRALWRCALVKADVEALLPLVMEDPSLCVVQGAAADGRYDSNAIKYSTQKMVALETRMADAALKMAGRSSYAVPHQVVARAVDRVSAELRRETGLAHAGLSLEQVLAVRHVTQSEQISVVIGYAGSGKSTMLEAAREAWEGAGYRVCGAALAGKAAKGLEEASGISSRTLASWMRSWENGHSRLLPGDVFVLDEAGMVGSVQMARLVDTVERNGAKLVLVGDSEQLQAIGAGSAFKAIQDRVGAIGLEDVRRQKVAWQRSASVEFASHQTEAALSRYVEAGAVHMIPGGVEETAANLVAAYTRQRMTSDASDIVVLAHRRRDVAALNEIIRSVSQHHGWVSPDDDPAQVCETHTVNGRRVFAAGERLVFLANDRDIDVKNGTLGTVIGAGPGHLHVRPDGETRVIDVPLGRYDAFDYGYATTIHKAQGATAKYSFVLASETMDRHLAYVAMTRHRESVQLFADEEAFGDMAGLSGCLSRSGLKETTLDYLASYASQSAVKDQDAQSTEVAAAREALMRGDPKREALLKFAQVTMDHLRQNVAGLPIFDEQEARYETRVDRLDRVWPGQVHLIQSAIAEMKDVSDLFDLKGVHLLHRFETMAKVQAVREADPAYRANRYLNRWVRLMAEYQGLKNPTVEQADALQRKVRFLAEDIKKDYRASALISTGQVQVTGVQPFSLLARSLDVEDLLKGHVPSRSLGLSRGGPDFGPGM